MTLQLTPAIARSAYDFLCECPPFDRWNMPDGDDIGFKIVADQNLHGWLLSTGRGRRRKHTLVLSSATISHLTTFLSVLAHEMIHLHLELTGQSKGGEHNKAFRVLAERTAKRLGFDPKAF